MGAHSLGTKLHFYKTVTFLFGTMLIGQDKWTPLMIASQNGHIEIVHILLQNGAHVDVQTEVII